MGVNFARRRPTGALDSQPGGGDRILKQLHSQGHTIIVVHMISKLRTCGRVIELRTKIYRRPHAFAPIRGASKIRYFLEDNQHQTSTTTCDNVREALYTALKSMRGMLAHLLTMLSIIIGPPRRLRIAWAPAAASGCFEIRSWDQHARHFPGKGFGGREAVIFDPDASDADQLSTNATSIALRRWFLPSVRPL